MSEIPEERGFQAIGSQVPKIVSSLKVSASMPTNLRQSSGTTGAQCLARKGSSSTGRALTATDVARLLDGDEPARTDKAILASLPPSLASSLRERRREMIDPVYGFDSEFCGYEIGTVSAEDLQAGQALVRAAIQRCDRQTVASELTRMRALTKARQLTDDDAAVTVAAYAEELSQYPADIVRAACRSWTRREPWWPSWAELKAELDRLARRRKALFAALRPGEIA